MSYNISTMRQYFQIRYPDSLNSQINKSGKSGKVIVDGWISSFLAIKIDLQEKNLKEINISYFLEKTGKIKNKSKKEGLVIFCAACQALKKETIYQEDIDCVVEYLKGLKNMMA